jgi:hypothetical protein
VPTRSLSVVLTAIFGVFARVQRALKGAAPSNPGTPISAADCEAWLNYMLDRIHALVADMKAGNLQPLAPRKPNNTTPSANTRPHAPAWPAQTETQPEPATAAEPVPAEAKPQIPVPRNKPVSGPARNPRAEPSEPPGSIQQPATPAAKSANPTAIPRRTGRAPLIQPRPAHRREHPPDFHQFKKFAQVSARKHAQFVTIT